VLILVPLGFLVVDYIRMPVLFNGCTQVDGKASLVELSNLQLIQLGRYRGHMLHFSLDSSGDGRYFAYVQGSPNALVLAIDHQNRSQAIWGGLTRNVLEQKLDPLSPDDAKALRGIISGAEPATGFVRALTLHLPPNARSAFPVDFLYVVAIRARGALGGADRQQQLDILKHGLNEVMAQAGRDKIANLIIPNIGVDPNDPQTLPIADMDRLVLASAAQFGPPRDLYVSIYHGWSARDQAVAIGAITSAWDEACRALQSDPYLVNEILRLVVAALFVCLLVSSRYVAISLKNWLIISASFVGLGFGALTTEDLFVKAWQPASRCVAHLLLLLILAVLFPFLPKMNPQNVFDPKGDTQ
jgi:hypothetical protein